MGLDIHSGARQLLFTKEAVLSSGFDRRVSFLLQLTLTFRINVSISNFMDMLIDYPKSKDYVNEMFDKLLEMGVMTKD